MTHRRPNGLLVLHVWPYLSLRFVGRFSGEPGLANLAFFNVTVTLTVAKLTCYVLKFSLYNRLTAGVKRNCKVAGTINITGPL